MLENRLYGLKATLNFFRYGAPFILIVFITLGYKFLNVTDDQTTTYIIFSIIASVVIYGYFCGKYYLLVNALSKYLNSLKSHDFSSALSFGRMYYSINRKGILGADGSGLTIYDESAINNDISAYSKTVQS
jgi:hypothetical protein